MLGLALIGLKSNGRGRRFDREEDIVSTTKIKVNIFGFETFNTSVQLNLGLALSLKKLKGI